MSKGEKLSGFSLFSLWAGAAISVAEIMTGSLIAPLGIGKGILIILVGHLIGCFILAAVGVIGFNEKQPSLVSSRISLGRYGSYAVSVFNIIQLVGWTAIMLIQCTRSVQTITADLFGFNHFAALLILVASLVCLWAFYADRGISVVNNAAVVLLLVLCLIMAGAVLKLGMPKVAAGTISFGSALELSIIMPLSWVPLISDYTMSAKTAKGSFWGSFWGYFIGSCFMYIIGLLSAIYTGTSDPAIILGKLGMGYAALLVIVLSTVTTTFLDVYSSVLSTTNLVGGLSKKLLIIIFTVLGTLLAMYFPMESYQSFLYMIGSVFAPVFTVVLVDYFLYGKDRRKDAVNTPGLLAAVIGVFSYYLMLKYDFYFGSTLPSIFTTAIVYAFLSYLANIIKLGEIKDVKQNN